MQNMKTAYFSQRFAAPKTGQNKQQELVVILNFGNWNVLFSKNQIFRTTIHLEI